MAQTAFMGTTLPNGIVLSLPDAPGLPDRVVTLKGPNQPVDVAFCEEWLAAYAGHSFLTDGIVFGAVNVEMPQPEAEPVAAEHAEPAVNEDSGEHA